ncbi:tRNA pseudouridine synthase A [Exophiala dermatitidis NIH/UT8656]|uniref:tRNA pseudouridine synthase 1 n=1 Tax=Exophiala dermatitidis (strain ATCC 34100 / CBS 525.76 / NIH/UT8656) TaxID=858893 RepID=H6C3D6_EXODN|nr:tRNA pseudouridine synthase A [Exophiala dermatitidis NIH/UT8656]EHY58152.1 tRNA pseudouridine synthase A [Exophiala dermatitidis NIH/UT8656]
MFQPSRSWNLAVRLSRRQARQHRKQPTHPVPPPSPPRNRSHNHRDPVQRPGTPRSEFLTPADIAREKEDLVRRIFHAEAPTAVEEIVQARGRIWGGLNGHKRQRNEDEQAAKKRRLDEGKAELPIYATKFSEEDLAAEARKPKKKVAVLIGYAGTGYHGMQLTHDKKTIEGDLFKAFVAAGAISKANADDPKKSSFVRCARTDKGVHAAGNVISLKLIIEDPDIVKKINENLTPQIRVWGFERTNNSFSSYQAVDSRIYEYLIPSHSFLPPHPSSFLGRKLEEWAEKKGDLDEYRKRQQEVAGWWEKVDEEVIKPILAEYDEDVRDILERALWFRGGDLDAANDNADVKELTETKNESDVKDSEKTVDVAASKAEIQKSESHTAEVEQNTSKINPEKTVEQTTEDKTEDAEKDHQATETQGAPTQSKPGRAAILQEASKRIRQAYINAKRSYRIPPERLARIQEALNYYVGTKNYHNFTIQKTYRDPSSKRVIKSFKVNPDPILINGTEWLSMKVHGQSFMMHQIRKMVGMIALVVRCGCDPHRIYEALGPENISIPKAPSLGLLLERPVFDSYNKRAKGDLGKETIDFDKYRDEMDRFKQEQIYERMYRDEERENVFGNFFNHIDAFPSETFLFVTSGGIEATKIPLKAGEVAAAAGGEAIQGGDNSESQQAGQSRLIDVEGGDSDAEDDVRDNHGDEG